MSVTFNTQNKAKFTRSTLANLLIREIHEVRTVSYVNIYGLLFTTTSNSVILISFNVVLELPPICSRRSVMYIAKIEARASHTCTPACLHDCEALRKGETLKTLSTELYIVKDLPRCRRFKKRSRKGSNAALNLIAKMRRTVRMRSLKGSHSCQIQHQESLSQKIHVGGDGEIKRQQDDNMGLDKVFYIQITTVRSYQGPKNQ